MSFLRTDLFSKWSILKVCFSKWPIFEVSLTFEMVDFEVTLFRNDRFRSDLSSKWPFFEVTYFRSDSVRSEPISRRNIFELINFAESDNVKWPFKVKFNVSDFWGFVSFSNGIKLGSWNRYFSELNQFCVGECKIFIALIWASGDIWKIVWLIISFRGNRIFV